MQVDKNEGTFDHRLIGYQQVDLIISITDHFIKTFNDSASNTCTDCLSRQTHRAAQILSAVSDGVSSGSCSFLRPSKTTTVFAVVHLWVKGDLTTDPLPAFFLTVCPLKWIVLNLIVCFRTSSRPTVEKNLQILQGLQTGERVTHPEPGRSNPSV